MNKTNFCPAARSFSLSSSINGTEGEKMADVRRLNEREIEVEAEEEEKDSC